MNIDEKKAKRDSLEHLAREIANDPRVATVHACVILAEYIAISAEIREEDDHVQRWWQMSRALAETLKGIVLSPHDLKIYHEWLSTGCEAVGYEGRVRDIAVAINLHHAEACAFLSTLTGFDEDDDEL